MSVESSRRGRPGYAQDGIVEVAVSAFNEYGYEATSMGVLANRLGISKSAIYHHVDSKEALLESALDKALGGLEKVLNDTAHRSGLDRLEAVLRGTVRELITNLPYVTLLLRLRGNTEMERRALARRRTIDSYVAEIVAQAQAEGKLRQDIDARTASRLIFGTVNSLTEWYHPGGTLKASSVEDAVLALVFEGLKLR